MRTRALGRQCDRADVEAFKVQSNGTRLTRVLWSARSYRRLLPVVDTTTWLPSARQVACHSHASPTTTYPRSVFATVRRTYLLHVAIQPGCLPESPPFPFALLRVLIASRKTRRNTWEVYFTFWVRELKPTKVQSLLWSAGRPTAVSRANSRAATEEKNDGSRAVSRASHSSD